MSTAGISFGGLASGLDTKAIISALVALEERPIRQLESKRTSLNKQKSLFGDLKGLLDKLSTAAKALQKTTDFLAMKASSDKEDILTASASNSATPGTTKLRVERLASAQVNSTTGSASPTASLGNGPMEFDIDIGGSPQTIVVNDPTLQSIAAAINDAALGVRADVVDTGNTANGGANRYQLVVRATETGSAGAFSISSDPLSNTPAFNALIADLGANVRTAGQDAKLILDGGIEVYRASNTIADVITGVTLDLKAADLTKEVVVTVTTDAEATSKKVEAFVEAYNKVVDFFAEQSKVDSEGKASGPLFGDVTLRSIRTSLRGIAGSQVSGTGNEAYQLLSQLGVTSDTQGKLTFNRSKFEEALAADENAVAAVFTDATNGIAIRLENQIKLYTDSVEGLIKTRTEGFDRQVKNTTDRITQAERRLENYQKQLEQKYANLESLLSRLQGQGSGLSSLANATARR